MKNQIIEDAVVQEILQKKEARDRKEEREREEVISAHEEGEEELETPKATSDLIVQLKQAGTPAEKEAILIKHGLARDPRHAWEKPIEVSRAPKNTFRMHEINATKLSSGNDNRSARTKRIDERPEGEKFQMIPDSPF